MSVDGSRRGGGMTQITQDDTQIDSVFQEMRCVRMSEGMNGRLLAHATFFERCPKSTLQGAFIQGLVSLSAHTQSWEQPHRITMGSQVTPQHLQTGGRQWHITIFAAFSMMQVEHLAFPIDLGNS